MLADRRRGADAPSAICQTDALVRRIGGRGVRRTAADEGVRATLKGFGEEFHAGEIVQAREEPRHGVRLAGEKEVGADVG